MPISLLYAAALAAALLLLGSLLGRSFGHSLGVVAGQSAGAPIWLFLAHQSGHFAGRRLLGPARHRAGRSPAICGLNVGRWQARFQPRIACSKK